MALDPKLSSADVLEALHQVTGMPIVADYYTRLYPARDVSVENLGLFDALNRLADAMRMRWNKEGEWLQLRSTSFYDDRLKEVPNRLLARWSATRRNRGMLALDDLVEIAQLLDSQLDAAEMAEGARVLWGLEEWDLARSGNLRPHLRFLAALTSAQREEAMSSAGLLLTKMTLAQQQQFIALALHPNGPPLRSLEELAGAALRVEYTQPGWFQWGPVGWGGPLRWVIPLERGPGGRRVLRPRVIERTREAALQAVRRIDPQLRQALLEALRRRDSRLDTSPRAVEEDQIFPTRLDLTFAYIPGVSNARGLRVQGSGASGYPVTW